MLQVGRALLVVFDLRRCEMLPPIHLDDESWSGRIEVHNVITKWFLTVELHSEDLFATQL